MDDIQCKELEQLRQNLDFQIDWDISTLSGLFRDYLQNQDLCNVLITETFINAVVYCVEHRSDNRKELSEYLSHYFTRAGMDVGTLPLVSIALYLGHIDSEISPAEKSPKEKDRTGVSGATGESGQGGSGKAASTPKRKTLFMVSAILAGLFLFIFFGNHDHGKGESSQMVFDICRVYTGKIVTDDCVKSCKISIHFMEGNKVKLIVTNTCDPNDVEEYTGRVEKNKLSISKAPDLKIKKLPQGQFALSGSDRHYGNWFFQSY